MTFNHSLDKISFAMEETFEKKCDALKKKLGNLSPEARYAELIQMGRALPPFPSALKTPDHLVPGCQSLLYLHATYHEEKIYFEAHSDALISAGLAALLIAIYSGESPETILKHSPHFLNEIGLTASLSPNRSNGLAHIHLRMQQEALHFLIKN